MIRKAMLVLVAAAVLGCAVDRGKSDAGATTKASSDKSTSKKQDLVRGWLSWRGPDQTGVADADDLPDKIENGKELWSFDIRGRGTPVIADGRLFSFAYEGEGSNIREVLLCLDAETGKEHWRKYFNDFLSDNIYQRYSIGSPAVDPETGYVYLMTTPGEVVCFDRDGKLIWDMSMMEKFGRLTFPNGRLGAPAIDGNFVIIHAVTSNWGTQGPPRDRFYAFDKRTGDPVWMADAGVGPPFLKDSSFALPIFKWRKGVRVFYVGLGDGNLVSINAKTGEPIWRYQFLVGGINSTIVPYKDTIIAIHGKENIDSTEIGRMIALRDDVDPIKAMKQGQVVLKKDHEVWRNPLGIFTSSPIIVNDRVYQTVHTGELYCIDAKTGERLWHKKLALSQLHASPLYGDGKLYVPMVEGDFYVIEPGEKDGKILSETKLDGSLLGAPAYWNGKIYVHSTEKLYCFGERRKKDMTPPTKLTWDDGPKPGKPVAIQVVPNEVLLKPGQKVDFRLYKIDEAGNRVEEIKSAKWEKFIPPTAKVKVKLDADFNDKGELVADKDAKFSAGAFRVTADGLQGFMRGRILPDIPFEHDFEDAKLVADHPTENVKYGFPPLPWIGARFKWDVRDIDGSKVLVKTTDNLILQRAMTFFGHEDQKNYTIQADVMTDRARRLKGVVGVINQRYVVALKASHQQIEVFSNYERLQVGMPFESDANKWYTLKARVDVNRDGSGVVRGKCWERGTKEPSKWTIEVPVDHVNMHGSPGVFGLAPQNRVKVYVDNIKVTPNK